MTVTTSSQPRQRQPLDVLRSESGDEPLLPPVGGALCEGKLPKIRGGQVGLLLGVGRPVNCGLGGRLTGVGVVTDGVGGRGGNDVFTIAFAAIQVAS